MGREDFARDCRTRSCMGRSTRRVRPPLPYGGTPESHLAEATKGATPITELEEVKVAGRWARRYPPLLSIGVALLIAVAVLPSALNLPQTPPTQTLEYAPVPPDDQNDAPPQGNFAAFGLGRTSSLGGTGALGGDEGGLDGLGTRTTLKPVSPKHSRPPSLRCVQGRQTEDPLSPPCVATFDGDNFGATYQGVTGDEVRVVIYLDGGINYINASDAGNTVAPASKLFDLFQPCDEDDSACDYFINRALRSWMKYFNDHFQTYGRVVHFWVYWSNQVNSNSPDNRQADAAEIYSKVKPFAVVSFASEPYEDTFLEAMTDKQVLNFGSFGGRQASFFQAHPKLIWGYLPSLDQQADQFGTYLCSKVVPYPVSNTFGDPAMQGEPRTLGFIHAGPEQGQPGLLALYKAVRAKVEACGGKVVADAASPDTNGCLAQDNNWKDHSYGPQAMADFSQKVTTIIWTGCIDGDWAKSAAGIGYHPEWILIGDGQLDGNNPVRLAQASAEFDGHAVVVTPQTYEPALQQQTCYKAYREVDNELSDPDAGYICDYYKNLFQLFVGIQVAGPRLGPTSIDEGFHAIPQRESGNPSTPACFYRQNDYTCVKDAQAEYWDASAQPPGDNRPGCWRSLEGGRRYLPGKWPAGNIDAQYAGNEPCNAVSFATRTNLA